jgi:hypothetical protein
VRGQPGEVLAFKKDFPRIGLVKAGDAVKAGGLPGAIWPDETANRTGGDIERKVVQRIDPAKVHGKVPDGK